MPRGKKKLTETTDLPIVHTDIEEGEIPYFLIDDAYGVACDERCEMLCRKKECTRTVNDEDGKPHHIETYYKWESFKYVSTFSQVIDCYMQVEERRLKSENLVKTTDYNELIKVQEQIGKTVSKALNHKGVNKDFFDVAKLLDQRSKLEEQIAKTEELRVQVEKEYNSLMELVKARRSIIIKETEKKKKN